MRKIFTLLLLLQTAFVFAANYTGQKQEFTQPDGSKVTLKLYGSEFYMRAESLDGYTVIRDKSTKWICYAILSKDGSTLESTGVHYTGAAGETSKLKARSHVDITLKSRETIIKANQKKLGRTNKDKSAIKNSANARTPEFTLAGNVKGLCIVVDFSDEPGTLPISEFEDFCNKMDYNNFGNHGSLRTFYSDISGGLLDYQNVVFGYFRAPKTFAEYDAMPYAAGAQEILQLALEWIESTGFDFNTLTLDGNTIKAINLMYTGNPPNWAQGMWYHMSSYGGFTSASGVQSGAYIPQ